MQTPDFYFYATLLDSYTSFLHAADTWEKYWGFADNPDRDLDTYLKDEEQALIDRVNRVPFDSEAADRGTAYNELIDCLIERRPSCMITYSADDRTYTVTYHDRTFRFPRSVADGMARMYEGALTQQRVEADLPTRYGTVRVYGVIDELMPLSVHDIKTTGKYTMGKFRDHWQHIVYPYCLAEHGTNTPDFRYDVVEISKSGSVTGTYSEFYHYVPERDIPRLRTHCEDFITWLMQHRDRITDRKIFNLDRI